MKMTESSANRSKSTGNALSSKDKPLLEARNIDRVFQTGTHSVQALATISLSVFSGDFLVITGPSGAGKSTLLNILSGLDHPTHGDIFFNNESLLKMNTQRLAWLRNSNFGFIFQTPHLLPDKTVLENVMLPFYYGEAVKQTKALAKCRELLDYIELGHMEDRYPNTLSGGEMQRVVFARALTREPRCIFADEPTGSLDSKNSDKLLDLLQQQVAQQRSVIMVSHDKEAIAQGSVQLTLNKC